MILWLTGWRHMLRHPLQMILAILGIALGVAVVVGIDLANTSAERAFRYSARALAGRATHQMLGGPGGLEETVYSRLRVAGGVRGSAPVVEGYAAVPALPGLTLQLLGLDPFAEGPFRAYSPAVAGEVDLGRFMTEPGAFLLAPAAARRLGLQAGDSLLVTAGGQTHTLVLSGYLEAMDKRTATALDSLAVMDIATAQELLGMVGRLSRIDLLVPEGSEGEEILAQVKNFLPPGAVVLPAGIRGEAMDRMTRAFRLNLTALSMLALAVGTFLIFNTMTFAVLRRRSVLGILRTLGVTRQEIFRLILGEAVLVGAIGTALGLLLGWALGSALLQLVTRTINDLYFTVTVTQVTPGSGTMAKGMILGLGVTVISALMPAREATAVAPGLVLSRSTLEGQVRRLLPLTILTGAVLLMSGALFLLPGRSILLGFVALFFLIAGYALLTPAAAVLLLRLLQPLLGGVFGLFGRMAARTLTSSLSRTGVAIAALMVAVSAVVGVGLMIGSFRSTVQQWLTDYLRADIYITTAAAGFEGGRFPLHPEAVPKMEADPEIAEVTRASHLSLPTEKGPVELFVVDLPQVAFAGYSFRSGEREKIRQALQAGAVIVSEPFAYHRRLQPGDSLRLRTDQGDVDFPVAGIFTDYASDRGRVVMGRRTYERFWTDRNIDSLGVYLVPGADPEIVARRLRAELGEMQDLVIRSNQALREVSLATFDRTFVVTGVLRLLVVLVAFVGILNALTAMQVERARELAVLRSVGLTPGRLWVLVSGETALIGLLAGLLALPLGILQALLLVLVVNRRSFGWTMPLHIEPVFLAQAVGLALLAALLAGAFPAWRMARTSPAIALREE